MGLQVSWVSRCFKIYNVYLWAGWYFLNQKCVLKDLQNIQIPWKCRQYQSPSSSSNFLFQDRDLLIVPRMFFKHIFSAYINLDIIYSYATHLTFNKRDKRNACSEAFPTTPSSRYTLLPMQWNSLGPLRKLNHLLLKGTWIVGSLWLLWLMLLQTSLYIYLHTS